MEKMDNKVVVIGHGHITHLKTLAEAMANINHAVLNHDLIIPKGIEVRYCPLLDNQTEYVQIRFPKSKKKRIRKKWAKRPENYGYRKVDIAFIITDPPKYTGLDFGIAGNYTDFEVDSNGIKKINAFQLKSVSVIPKP